MGIPIIPRWTDQKQWNDVAGCERCSLAFVEQILYTKGLPRNPKVNHPLSLNAWRATFKVAIRVIEDVWGLSNRPNLEFGDASRPYHPYDPKFGSDSDGSDFETEFFIPERISRCVPKLGTLEFMGMWMRNMFFFLNIGFWGSTCWENEYHVQKEYVYIYVYLYIYAYIYMYIYICLYIYIHIHISNNVWLWYLNKMVALIVPFKVPKPKIDD